LRKLAWIVLVVVATLGAAFFARIPLATMAAERWLAAHGLGEARFTLRVLAPDRLLVSDIRFRDLLHAENLAVAYSLDRLLARRIDRVAVEGVTLDPAAAPLFADLLGGAGAEDEASDRPGWTIGEAELRDATLRLPGAAADLPLAVAGRLAVRPDGAVEGEATVSAEDGSRPGRLAARLTVSRAANGAVSGLAVLEDAAWRADGLALDGLTGRIALRAAGQQGGIAAGEAELRLSAARIEIGGGALSGVALSLPLALRARGTGATVTLREAGTLEAARVESGAVAAEGPVAASLEPADAPLLAAVRGAGGWNVEAAAILAAPEIALRIAQAKASPLAVAVAPGRVALSATAGQGEAALLRAAVEDGALRLPAHRVAIRAIAAAAEAAPGGGTGTLRLSGAVLRSEAAPALFTPVALEGEARLGAGGIDFRAEARAGGGRAVVRAAGRHALADGGGAVRLRTEGFDFAPGGLQPASLAPALAALSAVRGRARAEARLAWSEGGLSGEGEAALEALSFTAAGLDVAGLDGRVRLSRLLPPASAGAQSLRIRRIGEALPVEDVALRFALPQEAGRLIVERLAARFAGGTLAAADAAFTPEGSADPVRLRIEGVGVAPLFEALGLAGVSGTGTLGGEIPVRIGVRGIAVEGGRLAAEGPGLLRIRSERVLEALRAGGEEATLLARALEDFHYERLTLALDKAFDGATRAALHLAGHNPAVRDGQPFRLNVNLDTNLDRLAAPLLEGYRLWGRTLGDIIAPRR